MLDRTISGGVTLDDVIFHVSMEDLPFGGSRAVGDGRVSRASTASGRSAMRKAVYKQSKLDVAKLAGLKPPYGAAAAKTIARMMRG